MQRISFRDHRTFLHTKRIAVVVSCWLFAASIATGQLIGTAGPVQFPASMQPGEGKLAIEMALMKMPEAVVEEADTYRWPSWTFDAWYGLPANFMLEGRVTTQFINWHVQAGPKWQYGGLEPVNMYVGADVAYFVGGIGAGAFDNSNRSSFFYPNVAVGWRNENLAITLKGELNYCLSKIDRAGDIEVSTEERFFNGGTIALYLEQPFWGNTVFNLGFRYSSLRYIYQNWLLFPTIDKFYPVPEFMLGVRL